MAIALETKQLPFKQRIAAASVSNIRENNLKTDAVLSIKLLAGE